MACMSSYRSCACNVNHGGLSLGHRRGPFSSSLQRLHSFPRGRYRHLSCFYSGQSEIRLVVCGIGTSKGFDGTFDDASGLDASHESAGGGQPSKPRFYGSLNGPPKVSIFSRVESYGIRTTRMLGWPRVGVRNTRSIHGTGDSAEQNGKTSNGKTSNRSGEYEKAKSLHGIRVHDMAVFKMFSPEKLAALTVDETLSVFDATRKMIELNKGSLLVKRKEEIVGIITERDYLTKILHKGKQSQNTLVNEIATMDDNLVVALESDLVQDCVDVIAHRGFRHLPVADNTGKITAVVSITDIAAELANNKAKNHYLSLEKSVADRMPIHDG